MKNVVSLAERAATRSRSSATRSPMAFERASAADAPEITGRLPEKPKFPPQPVAKLEISEEGRELLARLAERTEREFFREPPEETIEQLVAEGIEEGFLD